MKENPQANKFFEELAKSEISNVSFVGYTLYASSYQETPPPLLKIIGLAENRISDIAISAIKAIEEYEESNTDWFQFKWRLWAFLELQDVFDTPIYSGTDDILSLFQTWYFYYESKYILIESLLAGFNGFYHASETILRSFLEFNVLQNYYYLRSYNSESYLDVINCLKTGIKPKWSNLIKNALPNGDSTIPINAIRKRVNAHYDALSKHSSHAYHQDFSPKITNRVSIPSHSLVGVQTFWRLIDFILESILWMYYVNFPMVLQPKNIVKKFGYNSPLGVFIDSSRGHIMRNALKKEDIELFQNFSDQNIVVKSLNEWYDNHKDLALDEIKDTWNINEDGEFPDNIEIAYLQKNAKLRAIREAMSLQDFDLNYKDHADLSKVDFTLAGWENIFSAKKQKDRLRRK